jgi:TetR/AcrR family transcriptional regulator, copper-responsive repressor
MVQKTKSKQPKAEQPKAKRGRPRAYDPLTALAKARDVFWEGGFSAASLDDLSAATGMNRPSLYGAFGDKRALYGKALEGYREMGLAAMHEALDRQRPLREGLRLVYAKALSLYFPGDRGARGCFMIGTAVTEAVRDAEVRGALLEGFRGFDKAFEARLRQARKQGELPGKADPAVLAKLASSCLYFLAIRSRTGETRETLESFADAAVELICAGSERSAH